MDQTSIRQYIVETFAGVEVVEASGDSFFFYGPDHKIPFITLTTSDAHDQTSNPGRPDAYRLNIGVGKQTFQSLFGPGSTPAGEAGPDRILPHPVYGKMYWVSVLNPGEATFPRVRELLAEAYDMAVRKRARTGQADNA
jgi:hypothetical protein